MILYFFFQVLNQVTHSHELGGWDLSKNFKMLSIVY